MAASFSLALALLVLLSGIVTPPAAEATVCSKVGTVYTCADTGVATTNGTNFQDTITAASCGDTIILTAGAVYQRASFILKNSGACTGTDADYITIQTSNLAGISAPGVRINPAVHAAAMPKLINDSSRQPVIYDGVAGVHHYKFIGLDISSEGAGDDFTNILVVIGINDVTAADLLATTHLVFDRLFIHPPDITASSLLNPGPITHAAWALSLSGADVWVTNSYIGGFVGNYPGTSSRTDATGVGVGVGPGPVHIVNNYIEAMFNNVYFGGADGPSLNTATISGSPSSSQATFSNVTNLQVGDYVAILCTGTVLWDGSAHPNWRTGLVTNITGNVVSYDSIGPSGIGVMSSFDSGNTPQVPGAAQWRGLQPSSLYVLNNTLAKPTIWTTNGFGTSFKSYMEVKAADGLNYEANIMIGGESPAIAMTLGSQLAQAPWTTIRNVVIRNNINYGDKDHGGAGRWIINLAAYQITYTSTMGSNVLMTNNLSLGHSTDAVVITESGTGVTLSHNTFRNTTAPAIVTNAISGVYLGQDFSQYQFLFRDNLTDFGGYGLHTDGTPQTLFWPPSGPGEDHNLVTNNTALQTLPTVVAAFPNSTVVANDAAVGFANLTACDAQTNYHGCALDPSSPYKGTASDGKDPGVDFAALDAALGLTTGGIQGTGSITGKGAVQ